MYNSITFVFLYCFFLVAWIEGAAFDVTAEDVVAEDIIAENGLLLDASESIHVINKRHPPYPPSKHQYYTGNKCYDILKANPPFCNFTTQLNGMLDVPYSSLTDENLAALNKIYAKICVPQCFEKYSTYLDCLNVTTEKRKFWTNFVMNGRCGQDSGDYCEVKLLRSYKNNMSDYLTLVRSTCAFDVGAGGVQCSDDSKAGCTSGLSKFSKKMGCCAEPYLGSAVRSCSDVFVEKSCIGLQIGSTAEAQIGSTAEAQISSGAEEMVHSIATASLIVFALAGLVLI